MANKGVYSREDNSPEALGRSVQTWNQQKSIDARFMEIYPTYHDIMYPHETLRIKPSMFVRTIPMVAPVLSRIRIVTRFYAVPIRILWQPWEKYIDISNEDYDFTLEEPYLVNCTSGVGRAYTNTTSGNMSFQLYYNVGNNGLVNGVLNTNTNNFNTATPGSSIVAQRSRCFTLDNGFVPNNFVKYPYGTAPLTNYKNPRGGLFVFPHDLLDYFDAPIGVDISPYETSSGAGLSDNSVRFNAYKAAAYQLCYSFGYRLPNVQKRVDDYYQMAKSSDFEFAPVLYASVSGGGLSVPVVRSIPEIESLQSQSGLNYRAPGIFSYDGSNVSDLVSSGYTDDKAQNASAEAVLRTSWDKTELFPLKAGANASMQAWRLNSYGSLEFVPSNISLTRKRFANWSMDYFTSSNPWQQRGKEAVIPVSQDNTLNLPHLSLTYDNGMTAVAATISNSTYSSGQTIEYGASTNPNGWIGGQNNTSSAITEQPGVIHTLGMSGLFVSPSNFRFAMSLQKIKEMSARTDGRYKHYLSKFFGSFVHDDRIDYPEFLGGMVQDLNIDVVTQTSESSTTDLGTLAGNGVSAKSGYTITYHAKEHTIILALTHIVPDARYNGGLDRQDNCADPYDWMLPQFSGLSEQPVFNSELACKDSWDSTPSNNNAFGYEPYLNYLRGKQNRANGAFRDSFNWTGSYRYYKPWIIQRDFGKQLVSGSTETTVTPKVPTLSDEFLTGRGTTDNSMFTVSDDRLLYPFIIDSAFNVRATRNIPSRGIPRI